jgi:hypothetical protein
MRLFGTAGCSIAGLGPVMTYTIISGSSGGDTSGPSGETPPNMMQLTGRVDALELSSQELALEVGCPHGQIVT